MREDEIQPRVVPVWPTAGRELGISRPTCYQLARENRFPVPVIRVGHKLMVSRAQLDALLGVPDREPVPA
jgi:hypothetical protein